MVAHTSTTTSAKGTTCLDDLLPGLAALQTGLEHARRPGSVHLGRSSLYPGYGCFAEASDGQESLNPAAGFSAFVREDRERAGIALTLRGCRNRWLSRVG